MHPLVIRTVTRAQDASTAEARYELVRSVCFELVDAETRDGSAASWPDHLGDLLDGVQLSTDHQQWIVQSTTWRARHRGLDDPLSGVAPMGIVTATLWRLYAAAYYRRFEFRFESLRALTRLGTQLFPEESMLRSFDVLASLGLRDPNAAADLARAVEDGSRGLAMTDVLLHGTWLAGDSLPDQDGWILRLADDLLNGGDDSPNVYFWRSSALRRQERYAEALESIDAAIARRTLRDNLVHQDYVRERELVLATSSIAQLIAARTAAAKQELMALHAEHLAEAEKKYASRAVAAENAISKSLTGVVEILGVFLALVAFLTGSGYLALKAEGYGQLLVGLGVLTVGTLLLVLALRVIVRPASPK